MSQDAIVVVIKETTVGVIGACRVGISNIWAEDYQDDQGQPQRGLRAGISVIGSPAPHKDFSARVHSGQRVDICGQRFTVGAIKESPDHRGSIEFLPAAP